MSIEYPISLPGPLATEYSLQDIDPIQRTELDSGRVRARRRFTNVPTQTNISHVFSNDQFEAFAGWWVHIIADGAISYTARLRTSKGMSRVEVRPTSVYQASYIGGLWRVTYTARILYRDVPSEQRTLELVYFDGGNMGAFVEDVRDVLSDYYTKTWPSYGGE